MCLDDVIWWGARGGEEETTQTTTNKSEACALMAMMRAGAWMMAGEDNEAVLGNAIAAGAAGTICSVDPQYNNAILDHSSNGC